MASTEPEHSISHDHEQEKKARVDEGSDVESITSAEKQLGVAKVEAISTTWTKWGLIVAYISLLTVANVTSLESMTTVNLVPFATSSFLAHSLVATVYTVQGCINAVVKPTAAKLADVFGRFESFLVVILIYVIGYIQQAASNNVKTYAAAQIFYSAGSQGLQVLQQIFAADTTDLLNRALFSTLFDIPFLWTTWAGAPLAQSLLSHASWRWGYGIWAIILPVAFVPFAIVLFLNQRKAKKQGKIPPNSLNGLSPLEKAKKLWFDLDFFGLLLLTAALCLLLLPLTLAAGAKGGWSNASMIAMIVIGCLLFVVFPFWERSEKLAPKALFPKHMFKNRTVVCGIFIGFFYFMAFYLSVFPYFSSYLLIVQGKSVSASGHITQTFNFASTVASIIVSLLIKYTAHYKYFVTLGACVYLLGMGLMLAYRKEGVSTETLVGCQIGVGIGGGMLNVPAQLGVQAALPHQNVAVATALFLTLTEIGGAVGSAISGAIWTHSVPSKLNQYLPDSIRNQSALIYGNVTLASTGWEFGTPERIAINRAYQESMTNLLTAAICVCIPLIPLSLAMANFKLDKMEQNVKGVVIGDDKKGGSTSTETADTQQETKY